MTINWSEVESAAFGVGGEWVPVDSVAFGVSGAWKDVESLAFVPGDLEVPPPPPPPSGLWLGQYRGNPNEAPDAAYFNAYGSFPMATASYYTNQVVNETYEKARLLRGTHLFADLDTKATANLIADVAAWNSAGQAYVDRFWAALERLALAVEDAGGTAQVWGAFCHEFTVKRKQIQSGQVLTGVAYTAADLDLGTFAAAMSRFLHRREEIAPHCLGLYWMGGMYSGADDVTIWGLMTEAPNGVAFDDYVPNGAAFRLPTPDWQAAVNLIRGSAAFQSWGDGVGLYVGEFGIDTADHGDANSAAYYGDVVEAMTLHGITGAVQFNRNKTDPNGSVVRYDIETGSTPLAKAAFAAELAQVKETASFAPAAPTNVTVTARGDATIDLSWTAATVSPGSDPVTEYRVYDNNTNARVAVSAGTTVQVSSLAPATAYEFTVTAWNGIESAESDPVSTSTTSTTTPPNAPSLSNTDRTASSVSLSWTASTVPVGAPAVSEYRVYRGTLLVGTVNVGRTFTDTGLTAATAYSYTVKAYNGAESVASNVVAVTTMTSTNVAPNAPTNLRSTNVGATTVNLAWNASTLPTGALAVTEYRIFRGATQVGTAAGTATAFVVTGLTASTAYTFTVRAYNGLQSAASNALSLTTSSGGNPTTWTLIHDLPLTTRPTGTSIPNQGIRTSVDRTYNRASQVTFGADGMTILCEYDPADPQNATYDLYSADVQFQGQILPTYFAAEGTMEIKDYLGPGMFPAWWFRPAGSQPGTGTYAGQGEIDWWEFCGGDPGGFESRWKTTLIATPYSGATEQTVDRFRTRFTDVIGDTHPLDTPIRWRIEHVPNPEEFRIFVALEGNSLTQIGQMDRADWERDNSAANDPLYNQFTDATKGWYFRVTYQAGNGTGNTNSGTIPGDFAQSRLLTRDVQIYRYNP